MASAGALGFFSSYSPMNVEQGQDLEQNSLSFDAVASASLPADKLPVIARIVFLVLHSSHPQSLNVTVTRLYRHFYECLHLHFLIELP